MGFLDSIGDLFTGGSSVPMRRTEVNFPQPPQQPVLPSNNINIAGYEISQNMIIYGVLGAVVIYLIVK